MTDGPQAHSSHRTEETGLTTTHAAKADAAFGDALRRTQFEVLDENIRDITALREAARHVPLHNADVESIPTFRRGAVGAAVMEKKLDVLNAQLPRWEMYFSKNIDNLLRAYDLLRSGESADPRAVNFANEASSNILGALERTLTVRLAS